MKVGLQIHRTTAQSRLERTLKNHLVQTFMGKGAQIRLSGTLSSSILRTSSDGEVVSAISVLTVKKYLSFMKMKFLLVLIIPITPCLCHVAPCEGRSSILFVATL